MRTMETDAGFDESGWWMGRIAPWEGDEVWTLFAREDDSRMLATRWQQQAKRFFRAQLAIHPDKRYPSGGRPRFDCATIDIGRPDGPTGRLGLQTLSADDAPALRARALKACVDAGGGMDALVARSPRLWQWRPERIDDEPRAPLALAALLASLLLGPVLPPDERTVYGVRGARLRLERAGWAT